MVESSLGNNSGVTYVYFVSQPREHSKLEGRRTEPSTIRSDTTGFSLVLALLKVCSLNNFTVLVADRLPAREHLQAFRILCISVEVLALDFLQGDTTASPSRR
jgi:hypothetical protein